MSLPSYLFPPYFEQGFNLLVHLLFSQVVSQRQRPSSSKRGADSADHAVPAYAAKKLCHIGFTQKLHDLVSAAAEPPELGTVNKLRKAPRCYCLSPLPNGVPLIYTNGWWAGLGNAAPRGFSD